MDPQTTLTMLWQNSSSITGDTRWTGVYLFFTIITSCPIVCYCLLFYKFMCLSVYQQKKWANEHTRISAVILKIQIYFIYLTEIVFCHFRTSFSSHLSALEKVPDGNLGETKGNGKAPYYIWRWKARQYGAQLQAWNLYHILLFPSTCHTFCSCTGKMNMRICLLYLPLAV